MEVPTKGDVVELEVIEEVAKVRGEARDHVPVARFLGLAVAAEVVSHHHRRAIPPGEDVREGVVEVMLAAAPAVDEDDGGVAGVVLAEADARVLVREADAVVRQEGSLLPLHGGWWLSVDVRIAGRELCLFGCVIRPHNFEKGELR